MNQKRMSLKPSTVERRKTSVSGFGFNESEESEEVVREVKKQDEESDKIVGIDSVKKPGEAWKPTRRHSKSVSIPEASVIISPPDDFDRGEKEVLDKMRRESVSKSGMPMPRRASVRQGPEPEDGNGRGSSVGEEPIQPKKPMNRGRRESRFFGKDEDEDLIRIFVATRGLTAHDIDMGFEMLSKDKRKVSFSDIQEFINEYFDGVIPTKSREFFSGWKDEMTKDQLSQFLLNRPMNTTPFEAVFEWFSPDSATLTPIGLQKLASKYSKDHIPRKSDFKELLKRYDKDHDGLLSLEDFKRMSL